MSANTLLGACGLIGWRLDEALGALDHGEWLCAVRPVKERLVWKVRALIEHDQILTDYPRLMEGTSHGER